MSKLYVVFTNTDLTEGRGIQVPVAWSRNKYTAQRLAKGQGVMGSNAEVKSVDTYDVLGVEYIPLACVHVKYPSKQDEDLQKQDEDLQKQEEERNNTIAKMKALGVTDEMLQGLGVKA
jgi:hypothetical protein